MSEFEQASFLGRHRADQVSREHPAPACEELAASLFVTVAAKLYARTGVWPRWFVRVVGEDVPHTYIVLALGHRQKLEREFGVALPILHTLVATRSKRAVQLRFGDGSGHVHARGAA
jgi:hypothetical protein